ncbi:hypothetical protein [Tissierella sp.]|uniref:hypothetical protein n=1 Tax=Tissierella sp. TaxID=41274 RepID=UPI003024A0BD
MTQNIVRSSSEFFFNLYQKFNKELLEEILDEELDVLLLEKYYLGQKIDLYSKVKGTTTGVFVESMLQKADKRHLDFLLKLIDNIEDNAIIVFQAQAFSDKILEKILNKIRKCEKKIDFFAIEIDKYLIEEIESLNDIHFLNVINKLCDLNFSNSLNIVEKHVSIEEHKIKNEYEGEKNSRIEKRNKLLIQAIREKIFYYPTIYRERRCIANRVLTFGAGRAGIDYAISLEDRVGDTFVSVRFAETTEKIYKAIKTKGQKFKQAMGHDVKFDDANLIIRTDLKDKEFIYKTIDDLVEIFERYVFYLSNYIHYLDTNREHMMINQHKEGTL